MAEELATQTQTLPESSPAPADNDAPARDGAGPEVSSPESSPAQDALWTRLGYQNQDELESTHSRYKQMAQGSLQEQRRLQEAVADRDRRLQDYERRLIGNTPPAPQAPAELGFAQAV